ncbi:MAG: hypothetical protein GWN61_02525, partial [candidate division Zixibacteria bacterium]|nr:hypothetical protein [candidate division KSB1 bacterium]NIV05086.1 hypothetical protein [candidate division Zixibacteria bacterium]NIS23138.1 hypothetical protein [candidate division KSB1 bacterium]NIT70000.1 hypothetical protein [candidate division KSB1 bacterium]NIU23635.1 hypothetical protein [candidate division KSB1 bacterium]
MQTYYPSFEHGQVLTSDLLNDSINWLNEQDQLTRRKAIGAGIVCGLEAYYDNNSNTLQLSEGSAITTAGHLIAQDAVSLTQFWKLGKNPRANGNGGPASAPDLGTSGYPPFLKGNNQPMDLWSLEEASFKAERGETLQNLSSAFLQDKALLLYLEERNQPLKTCDINECNNKGTQVIFTVRKLLIKKSDADAILAKEEKLAQRPVAQFRDPKYDLSRL